MERGRVLPKDAERGLRETRGRGVNRDFRMEIGDVENGDKFLFYDVSSLRQQSDPVGLDRLITAVVAACTCGFVPHFCILPSWVRA